MDYDEIKKLSLEWLKNNPEHKYRLSQELMRAKIAYENGRNVYEEMKSLSEADNLSDGYILPVVLGFQKELTELKPIELMQVKSGGGGGLDIDTDVSSDGREKIKNYLKSKYGNDRVCSVGTYTIVGLAPAIKDILRKEKVEASVANAFTKMLDNELSFEENMNIYKEQYPNLYNIYIQHHTVLDFAPKIAKLCRSCGSHAGGILILDEPIGDVTPVVRPGGEIASAYTESGSSPQLDELGLTKFDLLGISQLTSIDESFDMAEKDGFYKIEDDDGIIKIVSKAYLLENGLTEEEIMQIQ